MKPEVKKRVRRYGIPIDLVILATGGAMLFPAITAAALVTIYLLAVVLSALKFRWRSGLTAMIFGFVVMVAGFGARLSGRAEASFLIISLIVIAASELRRPKIAAPAPAVDTVPVVTPEPPPVAAERAEPGEVEAQEQAAAPPPEPQPQVSVTEQAATPPIERRKKGNARRRKRERLQAEAIQEQPIAELDAAREERERNVREKVIREIEERAQTERAAAVRAAEEQLAVERLERERLEKERERLAHELEERATAAERIETLQREKEELASRLEKEREEAKQKAERERADLEKKYQEQLRAAEKARPADAPGPPAPAASDRGLFSSLASWLKGPPPPKSHVQLKPRKFNGDSSATRRPGAAATPRPKPQAVPHRQRSARILMLERRRATADVAAPLLRQKGVDVQIVERWVDAVDELFRFQPDAIFIDAELPDFMIAHRTIVEQAPRLPLFVTAGSHGALPSVPRAASVIRPYSSDAIAKLARQAVENPQLFLDRQQAVRVQNAAAAPPATIPRPASVALTAIESLPAPELPTEAIAQSYEVHCFNCHAPFDATEADWCSCLTKERTLVCTNCLTCFCKAPPSYKEKFWLGAPPRLFERKTTEVVKHAALPENLAPESVKRPLVMLVEDDADIQTIVRRVCSNLGYGFVAAGNGQDGLTLARLYRPNLILSDAFMPKLDGREMCRLLKEEGSIPDCTMIVMTGLYTDTKYKNEAVKRFHIDDYLFKPVSITDLINLLQKHLEGTDAATPSADIHETPRNGAESGVDSFDIEQGIALADLLDEPGASAAASSASRNKKYDVCCFVCGQTYDAVGAEWCTCLGRDQTLVCPYCASCFCKAPSAYRERFWLDAPPVLFERKLIGSKRNVSGNLNPLPGEVQRPLILLVEDDENIQLIVKTVVTTMSYGFIVAANGQEGLEMARAYNPDLILSDAFMPKLDGREMCRLLKEDPATSRAKAIIMTGLYTDRKYRNEALSYFKVDDYVAKPVAVDDLIKLMKKHLQQEVQPAM